METVQRSGGYGCAGGVEGTTEADWMDVGRCKVDTVLSGWCKGVVFVMKSELWGWVR